MEEKDIARYRYRFRYIDTDIFMYAYMHQIYKLFSLIECSYI